MRSTLLLAGFLAIVPFVSAEPTPVLAARQPDPSPCSTVGDYGGFNHQGCFIDSENNRVLTHSVTPSGPFTADACIDTCSGQGYDMAGVENGQSCYCDHQTRSGAFKLTKTSPSDCQMPCAGDSTECCGGLNYFILYEKS